MAVADAGTEGRQEEGESPPEMDLLAAWSGIERYGFVGWLDLMRAHYGNPRLGAHPDLMDALAIVDGELARLDEEEDDAR